LAKGEGHGAKGMECAVLNKVDFYKKSDDKKKARHIKIQVQIV
jgi:hypothetical protein